MNKNTLVNTAKKVTPAWVSRVSSVNMESMEIIENEIYRKSLRGIWMINGNTSVKMKRASPNKPNPTPIDKNWL